MPIVEHLSWFILHARRLSPARVQNAERMTGTERSFRCTHGYPRTTNVLDFLQAYKKKYQYYLLKYSLIVEWAWVACIFFGLLVAGCACLIGFEPSSKHLV